MGPELHGVEESRRQDADQSWAESLKDLSFSAAEGSRNLHEVCGLTAQGSLVKPVSRGRISSVDEAAHSGQSPRPGALEEHKASSRGNSQVRCSGYNGLPRPAGNTHKEGPSLLRKGPTCAVALQLFLTETQTPGPCCAWRNTSGVESMCLIPSVAKPVALDWNLFPDLRISKEKHFWKANFNSLCHSSGRGSHRSQLFYGALSAKIPALPVPTPRVSIWLPVRVGHLGEIGNHRSRGPSAEI